MKIAKNAVVSMNYTLTDPQGKVLDTSVGRSPPYYLHGAGSLINGLESALDGHGAGEKFGVDVAPADGYGERDKELIQPVPRDRFESIKDLKAGMQLQAQTEAGPRVVTIAEVNADTVLVDANHELAGIPLHFEVEILEVRTATPEELAHGHVHGPGGHHHH